MKHIKLQRQRGAALVVGLILLVVITLLAVVGMNIANTELAGATSEQLRLRAFNAAESGLEVRLQTLREDGKEDDPDAEKVVVDVENSPETSDGDATDTYTTNTTFVGDGLMISRYSAASFAGFYFRVDSTGNSSRNAVAQHAAGAYIVNGVDSNPRLKATDPDKPPVNERSAL